MKSNDKTFRKLFLLNQNFKLNIMNNNTLRTLESANIGSILSTQEMGFVKGGKKRGGSSKGSGKKSGSGKGKGKGKGRGHGNGHGHGHCGW